MEKKWKTALRRRGAELVLAAGAAAVAAGAGLIYLPAGLIAGGVTVVCAAAGTASRYKFYQGIVARELKKQLAPLNDKLDALQAENRMLRAELEKKNAPSKEQN